MVGNFNSTIWSNISDATNKKQKDNMIKWWKISIWLALSIDATKKDPTKWWSWAMNTWNNWQVQVFLWKPIWSIDQFIQACHEATHWLTSLWDIELHDISYWLLAYGTYDNFQIKLYDSAKWIAWRNWKNDWWLTYTDLQWKVQEIEGTKLLKSYDLHSSWSTDSNTWKVIIFAWNWKIWDDKWKLKYTIYDCKIWKTVEMWSKDTWCNVSSSVDNNVNNFLTNTTKKFIDIIISEVK